jgi:hypothetical protein
MRALAGLCLAGVLQLATAAAASPVDPVRDCAKHAGAATRAVAAPDRECTGPASLAARYAGEPLSAGLDVAPVRAIIAALGREHAAPGSWWDAIREWLRALADRTGTLSWLDRLLGKVTPSAGILTGVLYALLIAVLGTALAFVVAEVRAAGGFRRRDTTLAPPMDDAAAAPRVDAALGALETVSAAERPAVLLRLLVEAMRSQGRLQAHLQFTHRELIRRATLSEAERRRFARVAAVAEALLYGPPPGPADAIGPAVVDGRALLAELGTSDAAG